MIVGYDPARLARLRSETVRALDHLHSIRSDDPAAGDALARVRALQRVLDSDLRGAVDAISATDPLVRSALRTDLSGSLAAPRRHSTGGGGPHPGGEQFLHGDLIGPPTRFSSLTTLELMRRLDQMLLESDRLGSPDASDPFGASSSAEYADMVAELRRRVGGNDTDMRAMLVDHAATNPLVGYIVATEGFSDELVVAVAASSLSTSAKFLRVPGHHADAHRAMAITALLERILDDPALALDFLDQPGVIEPLATWNDDAFSFERIDDSLLADLVVTALVAAPSIDTSLESDAYRVLGRFVTAAQDDHLDLGFGPSFSAPLAVVLAAHAPAFLVSATNGNSVTLVPRGGDGVRIGDRSELVHFLGALMHDPIGLSVMTSILHDLAADITPDDEARHQQFGAFSLLLREAVDAENDDFVARADQLVRVIDIGGGLVDFAADQALSYTGAGAFTRFLVGAGIDAGVDAAADRVSASHIDAPPFDALAALVLRLESIRQLLDDAEIRHGSTDLEFDLARRAVTAVDHLFTTGTATIGELETAMTTLVEHARHVIVIPELVGFDPRHSDPAGGDRAVGTR